MKETRTRPGPLANGSALFQFSRSHSSLPSCARSSSCHASAAMEWTVTNAFACQRASTSSAATQGSPQSRNATTQPPGRDVVVVEHHDVCANLGLEVGGGARQFLSISRQSASLCASCWQAPPPACSPACTTGWVLSQVPARRAGSNLMIRVPPQRRRTAGCIQCALPAIVEALEGGSRATSAASLTRGSWCIMPGAADSVPCLPALAPPRSSSRVSHRC